MSSIAVESAAASLRPAPRGTSVAAGKVSRARINRGRAIERAEGTECHVKGMCVTTPRTEESSVERRRVQAADSTETSLVYGRAMLPSAIQYLCQLRAPLSTGYAGYRQLRECQQLKVGDTCVWTRFLTRLLDGSEIVDPRRFDRRAFCSRD